MVECVCVCVCVCVKWEEVPMHQNGQVILLNVTELLSIQRLGTVIIPGCRALC